MQIIDIEENNSSENYKNPLNQEYIGLSMKSKTLEDPQPLHPVNSPIDQKKQIDEVKSRAVDSTPKKQQKEKKPLRRQLTVVSADVKETNDKKLFHKSELEDQGGIIQFNEAEPEKILQLISMLNKGSISKVDSTNTTQSQFKNYKSIKSNFARSQAGKDDSGSFKTNQDSYMTMNKIFKLENYSIYGVFDGHGQYGHLVSGGINRFFNKFFGNIEIYSNYSGIKNLKRKSLGPSRRDSSSSTKFQSTGNDFKTIKEEFIYEKLKENNFELIKNAFQDAENELINSNFDMSMSGSTCVLVFIIKDKVICANVGDSRAIMIGKENKNDDETKTSNNLFII